MPLDDTPALTYCRGVLLPIWERWSDGDPSMRRALDCQSAKMPLQSREEQRNRLFAAAQGFHRAR